MRTFVSSVEALSLLFWVLSPCFGFWLDILFVLHGRSQIQCTYLLQRSGRSQLNMVELTIFYKLLPLLNKRKQLHGFEWYDNEIILIFAWSFNFTFTCFKYFGSALCLTYMSQHFFSFLFHNIYRTYNVWRNMILRYPFYSYISKFDNLYFPSWGIVSNIFFFFKCHIS